MKLALATLFVISTASALGPMRASKSLLSASRRLEENEDEEEEEEYGFLADYKLKLIGCKAGETYVNPENGEYEHSSVVFRLCPNEVGCSDEGSEGCDSGYGDYVVGLNTFVENYLEEKKEDMQQDDNFNIEEYGECREYEVDNDADDEDEEQQAAYYVGPACGEDGDIKLDFFKDEACSIQSEDVTFEEISNGLSLPYSSGGLVSGYCESCSAYNDNGEYELGEFCPRLYENSGKCETSMGSFSANGQQSESCELIESLMPVQSGVGAGKAIGWLFFILVVVGGGFVAYNMTQKKDERSTGLMA